MKPASPTLTLRFTEWSCGHHGTRPGDIEVQTPEQAIQICRAISHAISQPGNARAIVMGAEWYFEVYITDDHVSVGWSFSDEVPPHHLWNQRPVVICGSAQDVEAIHSAELADALDLVFGQVDRFDPTVRVEAGSYTSSTLSVEEIIKLAAPVDWTEFSDRKRVFEAPPRFLSAAEVLAELREEKAAEDARQAEIEAEAAAAGDQQ